MAHDTDTLEGNPPVVDNEDQGGDEGVWEQQGYSPLLNTTMAMGTTLGPSSITTTTWGFAAGSDDFDSDWEDDEETNQPEVETAKEGTALDEDKPATEAADFDFRSVADSALMQLEQDYMQTIQRDIPKQETEEPSKSPPSQSESSNKDTAMADFADWDDVSPEVEADGKKKESDAKILPDINSDAVRRAVSTLQEKHGSFSQKFNDWEKATSSRTNSQIVASSIVPQSHPYIPNEILQLYSLKHVTQKKQAEMEEKTRQLSRAATMVEALYRLDSLRRQERLVIHIIGCDHEEQGLSPKDSNALPTFLRPVLSWLAQAREVPLNVEFHLIGPNLRQDLDGVRSIEATAPFQTVVFHYHAELYHELLAQREELHDQIDLAISFHSGIWGYDSWKPTLQYLVDTRHKRKEDVPFVVTSYTLWEAQEDHDVIAEFSEFVEAWSPQISPFGSQKIRPTTTAPREQTDSYRENSAWQGWKI